MTNIPASMKPLVPYLQGTPRSNGEVDMTCPLHEDGKRSASLNVKQGVWNCFKGCGGGPVKGLLARRSEWIPPGGQQAETDAKDQEPLPSKAEIRSWTRTLLNDQATLDNFVGRRGLFSDTIEQFQIGWNPDRASYTIPVYEGAKLITIRFYNMGQRSGRKFYSLTGRGSAYLYPLEVFAEDPEEIIICEGELDALISIQAGFPAITRTGAAGVWSKSWNEWFKGRIVYLCHDCDDAGVDANVKVGRALRNVAADVRVIRLPYPITKDHGKDLTDFWVDHGGTLNEKARLLFDQMRYDAAPFDPDLIKPHEIEPGDVEAIEAFNADLYGKPIRMTLTVRGKAKAGYSLPHEVRMTCTRDAGPMCNSCPMMQTGQGTLEIEHHDPIILAMVGSTTSDVQKILKTEMGIPARCTKVEYEQTYQAVEILHARPSVEHVNGTRGDMTSIRITSVGRHNTSSNSTVQVVGALYANPRSQENEFLAWDVAETRTLDTDVHIDAEMIESLKRFQPDPGQTPLDKLKEIAESMSRHVTHIYGRHHLHAAMDLVWHSVLQFRFQGQMVQRGWLELLAVGDTRTGKSEAAGRLISHYGAGEIINCEAATFAGVVGGTQQIRNEWMLTWGVVPINDRRLVVLDEISGLSVEEIGQMSSMRSSGIASIEKVVQDKTPARTRMIWMGNPRDDITMEHYALGVHAIKPMIGRAEDIARFDLAMTLRSDEVSDKKVNAPPKGGATKYDSESSSALVKWAWTRKAQDVHWEPGAEALVIKKAMLLGGAYINEPPLILQADVRIKVARVAVAIAARLFSSETGDDLTVKKIHVEAAAEFIDSLYSQPKFGYRQLSELKKQDIRFAAEHSEAATQFINGYPDLWRFFRMLEEGRFQSNDLEQVLDTTREHANGIVNKLMKFRMITKSGLWLKVTPALQRIIKENVQ